MHVGDSVGRAALGNEEKKVNLIGPIFVVVAHPFCLSELSGQCFMKREIRNLFDEVPTGRDEFINVFVGEAGGKAATGEDVLAILSISQHLDMELTATVANATPAAAKALGDIGFVREGDKLVLNQAMGGR